LRNLLHRVGSVSTLKYRPVKHLATRVFGAARVAIFFMIEHHWGVTGDHPTSVPEVCRKRFERRANSQRLIPVIILFGNLVQEDTRLLIQCKVESFHPIPHAELSPARLCAPMANLHNYFTTKRQ